VAFLMFAGGAPARGGATSRPASINHACLSLDGFNPDLVIEDAGGVRHHAERRFGRPRGAMKSYVTMRMENRGGAPWWDPRSSISPIRWPADATQDSSYCGGSGILGNVCK
jgi:hypothetical protein